jgi:hypothetical protein
MIRDVQAWEAWEREYQRAEPVDIQRNFALMDAMYEHARKLGIFPLADPLEGLEEKFLFAKALNVRTSPKTNREEP